MSGKMRAAQLWLTSLSFRAVMRNGTSMNFRVDSADLSSRYQLLELAGGACDGTIAEAGARRSSGRDGDSLRATTSWITSDRIR